MNPLLRSLRYISRIVLPRIITIGLDIQDRHISGVVTLEGEKTGTIASGVYDLPEEAIQNGEIKQPEHISRAVQMLLAKLPPASFFKPRESIFILSVPPHHLYTETVFFPIMSDKDLGEAVHLKLETSLPWPLSQAYIDWQKIPAADQKQIGVFIAAISKLVLDEYLKIFLREGWQVGACEFHTLSMAKFIEQGHASSFVFALIDEDGIELSVFHRGAILSHYLQTINDPLKAQELLGQRVKQLVSYIESNFGMRMDKIFIFDKTNQEYSLNKIQEETGIAAQLFTPTIQPDPRLFIAYGAAQRSYTGGETGINLVSPEVGGRYRENLTLKTLKLWSNILVVFGITFAATFAGMSTFLWSSQGFLGSENVVFNQTLNQQLTIADPLIAKASSFNDLIGAIRQTDPFRSFVGRKLGVIQEEATRNGLSLTGAKASGPNEIIASLNAPTREAALDFQRALTDRRTFSSIIIPLAELSPEKDLRLNITIRM